MAFKNNAPAMRVSAARLAGAAGGGARISPSYSASEPELRRVSLEPDLSRIRPLCVDENAQTRKKRLAAKAVNFSATIIARIVILSAAGFYAWKTYEFSGQIHRGVAIGMLAMIADLGRVSLKAMEPGSK